MLLLSYQPFNQFGSSMLFKRTTRYTWEASDPQFASKHCAREPHWDRTCHAHGTPLCQMPCSRSSSCIPYRIGRKRPSRISGRWRPFERRPEGRSVLMIRLRIQPCHLREHLQVWTDSTWNDWECKQLIFFSQFSPKTRKEPQMAIIQNMNSAKPAFFSFMSLM